MGKGLWLLEKRNVLIWHFWNHVTEAGLLYKNRKEERVSERTKRITVFGENSPAEVPAKNLSVGLQFVNAIEEAYTERKMVK